MIDQLKRGDKVYFPDGDSYFYGEWTGVRLAMADGSDIHYMIHCHDCGKFHPVPKDEIYPLPNMGLEELPIDPVVEGVRRPETEIDRGEGVSLKAFKRAINREKYRRRRAMALVILGLSFVIVAGFSFLDGRVLLGSIATLAYIACFGLSYLVERGG